MHVIQAAIEISAPPEVVRQKFLDFSQLSVYHPDGFFKSIKAMRPEKPIEAGDQMDVVIEVGKMNPTIIENSPSCFSWGGGLPLGTFNGDHSFRFEPSSTTPGGTTFSQQEKFTGGFSFIIGEGWVAKWMGIREKTEKGFERYNKDLKAWCEKA